MKDIVPLKNTINDKQFMTSLKNTIAETPDRITGSLKQHSQLLDP